LWKLPQGYAKNTKAPKGGRDYLNYFLVGMHSETAEKMVQSFGKYLQRPTFWKLLRTGGRSR
jgi:hypothetical protein